MIYFMSELNHRFNENVKFAVLAFENVFLSIFHLSILRLDKLPLWHVH